MSYHGDRLETCEVKRSGEDPRLIHLTEIALTLPEATRQIYGSHAQFLVRKKTFAYFLDNHHGDGIVAVTCKVLPGDNKALADAQPSRFYLPDYLASRLGCIAAGRNEGIFVGQFYSDRPEAISGTSESERMTFLDCGQPIRILSWFYSSYC